MRPSWLRRSDAAVLSAAARWAARVSNDPEGSRAALAAWLAGDPRRRAAFRQVMTELEGASAAARILAGAADAPMPRPRPAALSSPLSSPLFTPLSRPRVCAPLAIAAALLALVLAGGLVRHVMTGPAIPVEARHAAEAKLEHVTLGDGSVVTLDAASAIAVTLTKTARTVRLERGRARFAVAHDAARPFTVLAGAGAVTARGTLFDVWLRPDGQIRVVLIEGAVDVALPAADAPLRRLAAGERLTFGAKPLLPPPAPAAAADAAWTTGVLEFERTPLAEVVLEANRYAKTPIVLGDPALGEIRVVGRFDVRATERLADRLAATLGLDLIVTPDARELRPRK